MSKITQELIVGSFQMANAGPEPLLFSHSEDSKQVTEKKLGLVVALEQTTPLVEVDKTPEQQAGEVLAAVAEISGLTTDQIVGHSRIPQFVDARHASSFLIKEVTGLSFPGMKEIMGGRDHSTLVSSHKRVEEALTGYGRGNARANRIAAYVGAIRRQIELGELEVSEPLRMALTNSKETRLITVTGEGLYQYEAIRADEIDANTFRVPIGAWIHDEDSRTADSELLDHYGQRAQDLLLVQ